MKLELDIDFDAVADIDLDMLRDDLLEDGEANPNGTVYDTEGDEIGTWKVTDE